MNNRNFMYRTVNNESELTVKKIVDGIIASGQLSRKDHMLLTSTVMIDGEISDGERRQINRIFDYIQTGRLKLVDW
ncbi:MAG: hypothetical protein QNJ47_01395 [Nostocaceae cyanobacterium]|nr:hypothetical protein [Nostocaceae cyanobacterium]